MGKLDSLELPIVSEGDKPTDEEVRNVIEASVRGSIKDARGKVGMLLSGGVDSTLLLKFVLKYGRIPVFTVVTDLSHPDLEAARKVAKDYSLEHYVLMPSGKDLERAKEAIQARPGGIFEGDAAVYLALELAKEKGVDTILAADGIDELTGGYWWHAKLSDRFTSKEDAFKYFWNKLEPEHISPLLDSASKVGIEVKFPYLDKRVVTTLTRIPLEDRVNGGITKKWWKDFARGYVSSEIVDRPKLGFVSSLDEGITSGLPEQISWKTNFLESEENIGTPHKPRKVLTNRPKLRSGTKTLGEVRLNERK